MGKAIKPKVNPKLQRLKRMPIEQLDSLAKQTAIKVITRGAEDSKDKSEDEAEDEKPKKGKKKAATTTTAKAQPIDEYVKQLKAYKEINHVDVAKCLSYERFPEIFPSYSFSTANLVLPSEAILKEIKTHKKYSEAIVKLDSNIKLLVTQKQQAVQKQWNVDQSQAGSKKVSKLGKSAATKAIFVDSLQEEDEEEEDDEDGDDKSGNKDDDDDSIEARKAKVRLEKKLRNQQNRDANRQMRDREQPSEEGASGPPPAFKKRYNDPQSNNDSGNNSYSNSSNNNSNGRKVNNTKNNMNNQNPDEKRDYSIYMPMELRDSYKEEQERPKDRRRGSFNKDASQQSSYPRSDRRNSQPKVQPAPNRAERRKATQMSGGAAASTTQPLKKIKFDEDSGAAASHSAPSFERTLPPPPAPTSSRPPSNFHNTRSNFSAPPAAPASKPAGRINHAALNNFAVDGKEWKESGVHPSWAAKQLSKPQIVQGQGKKITFD